jgi:diaminopimelate epimerase
MVRRIPFTKMHGLGNDFVVLDGIAEPFDLSAAELKLLADRHFGVGCDQVLLVERAAARENDFRYRIFNADGGEVEQCGNGARCFVRFVHDRGLSHKNALRVETKGGIIEPRLLPNGEVSVDMGVPRFAAADVPFRTEREGLMQELALEDGRSVEITALSMGNPHAVQIVSDVERAPVTAEGPQLEHHARFPERVNAGYMQICDRSNVRLRVWERGAGETLACGTGACAAAVAGIAQRLLDTPVRVAMRGGILTVAWEGPGTPVVMTGPAVKVFDGVWNAPER